MNLLLEIISDGEILSFNTGNVVTYAEEEMILGQNAIHLTFIDGFDFWLDKSEYRMMKEAIENGNKILEFNRDEQTFNRY